MSKRWYVIHTYSGYENKVKTDLEHRIETYGLENQVVDIKIPTEEVTEVKEGGKSEVKEAKVFPGYVLVRMEVDDNTWAVVRNTPGVTGFVGQGTKPSPLRRKAPPGRPGAAVERDPPSGMRRATRSIGRYNDHDGRFRGG